MPTWAVVLLRPRLRLGSIQRGDKSEIVWVIAHFAC
jgi:hypothetical protein